jgi:acetolactate synthase-1/2/3 large subunit
MGAALASPESKVIALTGDGGLGYHIGEIETALRCGIPFVILVQNNCTFASEYHSQVYNWKRVIPEVDDFYDVDYAAVAASYGAWSRRVDDASEIQDSLTAALDSGRPALLDVRISKEVVAPSGGYDRRLNRRV